MIALRYLPLCLTVIFASCNTKLPPKIALAYEHLPEVVDFNIDVKPILSDKCFACHGPDKQNQKANLRIDLAESALAKSEETHIYPIVPGKPGNSEAIRRILSNDPEIVMPPPESHLSLNDIEIATLIKWVDQGAEYKPHWSFITPEIAALPEVSHPEWPANSIDYFVLDKMDRAGFEPAAEADKETLIRRIYFNLTGLPPTLDEIEDFQQDSSHNAYAKLVDKLLASPAYGERMAMEWMDIARYADSDGYLDDKHRDFSPWRDWVISAFNENMPYDQFATWQLAGDLVPDASQESILATAFNRLHKKNSEAGIVFEEFRVEYNADRTHTFGKAFMGLTLECARCHDHKYDPILQEDYYKIFAYFNSTHELGTAVYGPDQTPGPSLLLTSNEQEKIIEYLSAKVEQDEQRLQEIHEDSTDNPYSKSQKDQLVNSLSINQSSGLVAYYPFDQFNPTSQDGLFNTPNEFGKGTSVEVNEPIIDRGAKNKGIFINDFSKVTLPEKIGWFERTEPFSVSLAVFPDTLYDEAGIFYHCEDFRIGMKGYSLFLDNNRLRFVIAHSWPQNAIQVTTQVPLPIKEWSHVTLTYDGSSKAKGLKIYLNGVIVDVSIDLDHLYKGILYEPDIHTYGFSGIEFGLRHQMKLFKNGGIDELRIYDRELAALEVLFGYDKKIAIQSIDTAQSLISQYYQHENKQAVTIRSALKVNRDSLNNLVNEVPEVMVMGDLQEPRATHVLERGVYDAPSKKVSPGVPESIHFQDQDLPANRLGLAKWLFNQDHPLTARVFVNRIWQMHFGNGIVSTADDFGNQGSSPTHPELLDWLAIAFRDSGWDIKYVHKLIVMSATFKQSSQIQPDILERDPYNKLLARGPSFRLSAEMIRDNALSISGLLVSKIGGPSVYPYQPKGLWDEISNKRWRYPYLQKTGDGLYRRSLYTIWKRTSPPPSMLIFDAPDRAVCTVKRNKTSTPLQALVLLNDPQYLESARMLAEIVLYEAPVDSSYQLKKVFTLTTGRIPDQQEMNILQKFYMDERNRFSENKQDALSYLGIGEVAWDKSLDPIKIASLATVVNGIMNTSDGYTLR